MLAVVVYDRRRQELFPVYIIKARNIDIVISLPTHIRGVYPLQRTAAAPAAEQVMRDRIGPTIIHEQRFAGDHPDIFQCCFGCPKAGLAAKGAIAFAGAG